MKFIKTITVTAFCILLQIICFAESPSLTKNPVPNWIRPTNLQPKTPDLQDINDGYYLESTEYQVDLNTETKFYRTKKVLTENTGAESAGQVHISFVPQYQTLILHELYVLRDGEKLDRLDLQKFKLMAYETELSRFIYNGTYSAYLLIDDLRKNDKIVLSFSIRGFNPVFEGSFFDSYLLQGLEPTGAIHINYIVPKHRKLYFKTFLGAAPPKEQDLGSAISYYWEETDTEHIPHDFNTPAWYPTRQRIECSEFEKWADVANWADNINPIPKLSTKGRLHEFVDELWQRAKGDSMTYVREVTDFVQNEIRYMGVEVGEYSHKANLPEQVFSQRYGDCKDKSVLMSTMLKHKGIQTKLVLVNSLEEYNLETYLPSPGVFNHMVVYLMVNDRGQYIDPTISNQGGHISERYFPFYGKVLHIEPEGEMHSTEKIVSGKTRIEERFILDKNGTATLNVLTTYSSSNADIIRIQLTQIAKNKIEKSNLEYYQSFYKQIKKLSPLNIEDDKLNNILRIKESYSIKKIAEVEKLTNRLAVSVYATGLSQYVPEISEARTTPIALEYPLMLEHDVYIVNPDGVNAPNIKGNIFVSRDSYHYGKSITVSSDTLKIAFRLGFHDTYVKESQTQEFIEDFSDLDNIFSSAVYINNDGFIIGSKTQSQVNIWPTISFVALLCLFTWIIFKFYHKRTATAIIYLYDSPSYNFIGGWLIILAIFLCLSLLSIFFNSITHYIFDDSIWSTWGLHLGISQLLFGSLLIFEFIINTFLLFMYGYCLYLLIKKRDIFPQTILMTLIVQVVFVLLDTMIAFIIFKQQVITPKEYIAFFRTMILGITWVLYLFKSTRVKGTFVIKAKSN